mmetsp:Transcript_16874/g.36603  ORF Transcript_16874/g.36603 Transcript_16874/m.36603 type:complete len:545 (-) Transcript_16874:1662-3296(-)
MTVTEENGSSAVTNGTYLKASTAVTPALRRMPSISEQASAASTRRVQPPFFLKWIEYPFRVKNIQTHQYLEEATGHAMDVSARGPINQTGSFVGSAILRLAATQAGGLDKSVYGIKASSILTVGNLIAGIIAGVTMPFVGALVDHTDHRKAMGAVSAFLMVMAVGAQLMLSLETWFAVFILEIIGGYFLIMHQVCTMAYLPDLSHDLTEMGHYTARLMMTQYMIQGVYTSIVVAVSYSVEMSNIQTAKLGAGMAFGLGVVLFGYAWTFLFRKRPKLRDVPEGSNILTTGFKQIAVTTKQVFSHYKALKWFMIALLWSPEAGAGTILAIAVTFLTLFVNMKVSEISVVSLVMLFSNIPGALLSRFMCKKVNPLNSFRLAEISFAIVNALIAGTVTGPERKNLVYFYAALMGVSFGWMFPSQRTVAVALIPKGQETEIMGLIAFFGQILGFLPAMIFTALNEAGVDMRWGVGSVSFFLLTSCLCTFMCGDFNEAVAKVAQSSDDYLESYSRKSRVEASFVDEDGEVEDGAQDAAVAVNESNHPSEA